MVARLTNGCFQVRIYCLIDSRNGRRASGVRQAECPVPGSSVTPTYGALGSAAATLSGQLSAFRLARREEAHVELLTLDAVVDPVTRGRNQFSRGDGGRMTDDRDEVSMPARFHTQYAEPSLGTVERHALRRCRREPRGGLRGRRQHGHWQDYSPYARCVASACWAEEGWGCDLGLTARGSKPSTWPRSGQRGTNLPAAQSRYGAEMSAKKACRVNWPSPKLRRQIGIRREIYRIVPLSNPQACCANACGSWAFSRSRNWRREFGPERTGAGKGI